MPIRAQKFTKTPFKKQADVLAGLLRNNPMMNDDEKASMAETVGVLTWLNQLQLHWAAGNDHVPPDIHAHIFEGREPVKIAAPVAP
jgi:hypothetical protein